MTFREWLVARGYRESTARTSAGEIKLARKLWGAGKPLSERMRWVLQRYSAYLANAGEAEDATFGAWVREHYAPAKVSPRGRPKERVHEAVSYSDEDWRKLCTWLARDPIPAARVLDVQVATGLRVGDVLRIRRDDLERALAAGTPLRVEIKGGDKYPIPLGGRPEVWERLRASWASGETLAEWVSPRGAEGAEGGFGAQKAVYRHLKQIAGDLGLRGRTHPHRLRRTVAVHALKETKDIYAVQQLLGHRSITSTQRYLDEPRLDAVEELQRKLAQNTTEP